MRIDLIVTRHPALKDYLIERGVADAATPVLPHAGIDDVQGKDYYPTRFQMQGSDGVWRRVYMRVYKRRRPVLVVEDGGVKYSIEPLDAPGITRLTRFYNTRTGGVVRVEFDYENMMEG